MSKAGIGSGKCIEFQNQKPALVGLAARLVEERVVRVHLLPALAAGRGLDRVRARERGGGFRGGGHVLSWVGADPGLYTAPVPRRTMRAIRQRSLGGPEVLELVDVPRPEPGPTEVLVRVAAAGVNPVDWKVRARGGFLGEPPFTVGWDVAGRRRGARPRRDALRALATASSACRGSRGEAAAYAEYVTSPSRQLARIPEGLGDVEAAALPLAGLTAWQALVETAGVGAESRVCSSSARPAGSGTSPCRSRRRAART